MMNAATLYDVVDRTWPDAGRVTGGSWVVRIGQGGGSRVSAATGHVTAAGLPLVEAVQRGLGQRQLWMIRAGDDPLDALLADRGYRIMDPVVAYAAPVAVLATQRPPPVTTFEVWPPLAVQAEIWVEGGVGPERLAVMDRAKGPKTTLLGRLDDQPAGTAYVAMHGPHAMLHALEVAPRFRRRGLARHMLHAAAFWAKGQGASHLSLVVTRANEGANALYASLGMQVVGQYHYRIKE